MYRVRDPQDAIRALSGLVDGIKRGKDLPSVLGDVADFVSVAEAVRDEFEATLLYLNELEARLG